MKFISHLPMARMTRLIPSPHAVVLRDTPRWVLVFVSALLAAGAFIWSTDRHVPETDAVSDPATSAVRPPLPLAGQMLPSRIAFEENRGQLDAAVRYLSRGPGYSLFLTAAGSVLSAGGTVLRMQLEGANATAPGRGLEGLAAERHYFIGNDPAQWHSHVPSYGRVRFDGVYPGIDVVYYGKDAQLEYDFVVAPGADPAQVRMRFDGAQKISVDGRGNLLLATANGVVRHHAPYVYQDTAQGRREIAASYRLDKVVLGPLSNAGVSTDQPVQVSFTLGDYDRGRPLVIDPSLTFSTFLGGDGSDEGRAIAVDGAGNFYVTGITKSPMFPGDNGLYPPRVNRALPSATDAFVSKYDKSGALLYSVYLGASGSSGDAGNAIAVDGNGNIYVTGGSDSSGSSTFPTTSGAYVHRNSLIQDVFISVVKPDGSGLLYSALISGGYGNAGEGIAVDSAGDIYVSGWSVYCGASCAFPTTAGSYHPGYWGGAGDYDGFMLKLHPAGAGDADLIYSTMVGGSGYDKAYGIAVDGNGRAYVTGETVSSLTTVNPLAGGASLHGGADAFVGRLSADGSAMEFLTYLGGDGSDVGRGIALDSGANIYVAGRTYSTDVFGGSLSGASDAFVAKLGGSTLQFATRLGGDGNDEARAIALDASNKAYVAGWTDSGNFPTGGTLKGHRGGYPPDAFVAIFDTSGAREASDYLGGGDSNDGADGGRGIAVDAAGKNIYVTGWTNSKYGFPYTQNAPQTVHAGGTNFDCGENLGYGGCDAFVARFGPSADLAAAMSDNESQSTPIYQGDTLVYTVTVTNNGPDTASNVVLTDTLPATADVSYISNDGGCVASGLTLTCGLGDMLSGAKKTVNIYVVAMSTAEFSNSATVTADEFDYPAGNNSASEPSQPNAPGVVPTSPPPTGSGSGGGAPPPFIVITEPPATAPPTGGGGGAIDPAWMLLLAACGLYLRRRAAH